MTKHNIPVKGATIAATDIGSGPTLVFSHGLGLNQGIWDGVIARFSDHRVITYDLRGHGASSVPDGPYSMGMMISDAEAVCDYFGLQDVCFVGLSVGGSVAQGLAVKRLDLIRAMVLTSSAAKNGQPEPWHERAANARATGIAPMFPQIFERWNENEIASNAARSILENMNPEGYAAMCEAIAGTDFYTPTSGLRLPTLGLCGNNDRATPPDLVRETVDLVPGSSFQLIKGAGHLPPLSQPDQMADRLTEFLDQIGHILAATTGQVI